MTLKHTTDSSQNSLSDQKQMKILTIYYLLTFTNRVKTNVLKSLNLPEKKTLPLALCKIGKVNQLV